MLSEASIEHHQFSPRFQFPKCLGLHTTRHPAAAEASTLHRLTTYHTHCLDSGRSSASQAYWAEGRPRRLKRQIWDFNPRKKEVAATTMAARPAVTKRAMPIFSRTNQRPPLHRSRLPKSKKRPSQGQTRSRNQRSLNLTHPLNLRSSLAQLRRSRKKVRFTQKKSRFNQMRSIPRS